MKMNRKAVSISLTVLAIVAPYWIVQAGDLEPPGPPDSTMVTLQDIFDKLETRGGGVALTGQTECWAGNGISITCAGTGQDGEYRAGVVSVGPRFTDNGDGTVTDNLTGLIWLQDASCFPLGTWQDALSDANGLFFGSCGLTDGSFPGDWRLPNFRELLSLIDYGNFFPALPAGHPFLNVPVPFTNAHWTSTTFEQATANAWRVQTDTGQTTVSGKVVQGALAWPVRGGQ